jgi:arginine/lysine/ornithine decarboxylase
MSIARRQQKTIERTMSLEEVRPTLLSALVRFKGLHETNAPLAEVLTEFTARHTARYGGMRLRDLCAEMRAFSAIMTQRSAAPAVPAGTQ